MQAVIGCLKVQVRLRGTVYTGAMRVCLVGFQPINALVAASAQQSTHPEKQVKSRIQLESQVLNGWQKMRGLSSSRISARLSGTRFLSSHFYKLGRIRVAPLTQPCTAER